jgi:hypothetical protein
MHRGDSRTRLGRAWANMRDRCCNPDNHKFSHYGGRGITIAYRWSSFVEFRDWAILNGYRDDLTIDRIDNASGYSPANCRWVTQAEQKRNTRTNRAVRRSDGVIFNSIAEAVENTPGAIQPSISKCCAGKGRLKTTAGYGWEYVGRRVDIAS